MYSHSPPAGAARPPRPRVPAPAAAAPPAPPPASPCPLLLLLCGRLPPIGRVRGAPSRPRQARRGGDGGAGWRAKLEGHKATAVGSSAATSQHCPCGLVTPEAGSGGREDGEQTRPRAAPPVVQSTGGFIGPASICCICAGDAALAVSRSHSVGFTRTNTGIGMGVSGEETWDVMFKVILIGDTGKPCRSTLWMCYAQYPHVLAHVCARSERARE